MRAAIGRAIPISRSAYRESDALHPQWVIIDLAQTQPVDSIRIAWAEPYALNSWCSTGWCGRSMHDPIHGVWESYPLARLTTAAAVRTCFVSVTAPSRPIRAHSNEQHLQIPVQLNRSRIHGIASVMPSASSILVRHPRTASSTISCVMCPTRSRLRLLLLVDPWHEASDLGTTKQAQVGFDVFFTSGVTRGLPAMMPVALLYDTPENAVAEVAYLKKRNYPISYIEMGEEADGQYFSPEDYGALYLQWATALHRLDPRLSWVAVISGSESRHPNLAGRAGKRILDRAFSSTT